MLDHGSIPNVIAIDNNTRIAGNLKYLHKPYLEATILGTRRRADNSLATNNEKTKENMERPL